MKELRKYLKQARAQVRKEAAALPDQDAYATPYSMLSDLAKEIDLFTKEIAQAMKDSKSFAKNNPQLGANRAKKWCAKP